MNEQFPQNKSMIASLLYLVGMTRPDISYAIVTLSRYSLDYTRVHVDVIWKILRYIKSMKILGLVYGAVNDAK